MRLTAEQADKNKTDIKTAKRARKITGKINWPDLVFGPVNLWSLPPASFFYREFDSKQ